MDQKKDSKSYFNISQFLGPPKIFPTSARGKTPASVKFIIPGFKVGESDKKRIALLANKCGIDLFGVDLEHATNKRTNQPATLVTFAFYVPAIASEDEQMSSVTETARLLIERFLRLLSFFAGTKLSAVHSQAILRKGTGYTTILSPISRDSGPPFTMEFPVNLETVEPNENVLSSLVWLRRGLAERDPVETFSALMVCLQIMARHLIKHRPISHKCQSCGAVLEIQEPSITSLVRELVVSKLGASPELFDRFWRARNAIIAHGNQPLTPKALLELTELKPHVVILAFKSIKLSLNMSIDAPPFPNEHIFVTDAFMYVD
jgi:hypothetical protein